VFQTWDRVFGVEPADGGVELVEFADLETAEAHGPPQRTPLHHYEHRREWC
jgi:hypothetical protein